MFKAINKPPKFVYVPTWIFDLSISMIESIAKTFPSQKWEDALETAKIGKYCELHLVEQIELTFIYVICLCDKLLFFLTCNYFPAFTQHNNLNSFLPWFFLVDAVEDMLTTEPDEKFGTMTMMSHFQKIANEGQDPFTPV